MWDSAHIWRQVIVVGQENAGEKKSNQRQRNGHEEGKKLEREQPKWATIQYHLLENNLDTKRHVYTI